MRGVFLDFGTVSNGDLDPSPLERATPGLVMHDQTPQAEVSARIAGFEIVFVNKSVIDGATIAANPQLRLIALTATGVDNVDVAAARAAGVAVCNLHDYCSASVAQHVFAVLLALTHRVCDYAALVREGRWQLDGRFSVFPYPIRELRGRVFGIVGYGSLGKAVAGIARAFGMRVEVANRPGGAPAAGRRDLDGLLPELDVLSLHCPLTDENRNLVNGARIASMPDGAILVNTGRGGLVDDDALREALASGKLRAAGLDAFTPEPLVGEHAWRAVERTVLTPHVGGVSEDAYVNMGLGAARNVLAVLASAPAAA